MELDKVKDDLYSKINLGKTVCFFDLESTGQDPINDQIVQICMIKIYPDGEIRQFDHHVKPDFDVSAGAYEKNGISLQDLADEPKFSEIGESVKDFLSDCQVLSGYNIERFDVTLLTEEMLRNGFDFNPLRFELLDLYKLMIQMEPRDLESTYKRLTGKEMEGAHDAIVDVIATIEIFSGQVSLYEFEDGDLSDILEKINDSSQKLDTGGYFIIGESGKKNLGNTFFNFGKHKGESVESVYDGNAGYFDWMVSKDFPSHTKKIAQLIKSKLDQKNET